MSLFSNPAVVTVVARGVQAAVQVGLALMPRRQLDEASAQVECRELRVPTSVGSTRVLVYRSPSAQAPGVHVNFHGGGFIMRGVELDEALCRFLAAHANVVVLNVDYVVAPQHPFPAPTDQAFEVVRWAAQHGAEHGFEGSRLSIGGQSAGGSLSAAVARRALEEGGPVVSLQVLQYPVLDLVTKVSDKPSPLARPMLKPWMAEVFDAAYCPDVAQRAHRYISPAHPSEVASLEGIAPAVVVTAEYDRLRAEGLRYARRLEVARALVESIDLKGVDHGYDLADAALARSVFSRLAVHVSRATAARSTDIPS